jgi:hypothetical protein
MTENAMRESGIRPWTKPLKNNSNSKLSRYAILRLIMRLLEVLFRASARQKQAGKIIKRLAPGYNSGI